MTSSSFDVLHCPTRVVVVVGLADRWYVSELRSPCARRGLGSQPHNLMTMFAFRRVRLCPPPGGSVGPRSAVSARVGGTSKPLLDCLDQRGIRVTGLLLPVFPLPVTDRRAGCKTNQTID